METIHSGLFFFLKKSSVTRLNDLHVLKTKKTPTPKQKEGQQPLKAVNWRRAGNRLWWFASNTELVPSLHQHSAWLPSPMSDGAVLGRAA